MSDYISEPTKEYIQSMHMPHFVNSREVVNISGIPLTTSDLIKAALVAGNNIILSSAQEGYDSHKKDNKWVIPKKNPIIADALARAKKSQRIIPVSNDTNQFDYATGQGSKFGKDLVNQAVFGPDVAEAYSVWLKDTKNKATGYDWLLHKGDLESIGFDNDHVEVRAVALGFVDDLIYDVVLADRRLSNDGRACGVHQIRQANLSTQNPLDFVVALAPKKSP